MRAIPKIVLFIVATALSLGVLGLSACSEPSRDLTGTVWHFESMQPAEGSTDGLDEQEVKDREANATMLSMFMRDVELSFGEEGRFSFKFLGDEYNGSWEKAGNGVHVGMDDGDHSSAAGTYELKDGKLFFTADGGAGRLEGYTVVYAEGAAVPQDPAGTSPQASNAADSKDSASKDSKGSEKGASSEGGKADEAGDSAAKDPSGVDTSDKDKGAKAATKDAGKSE